MFMDFPNELRGPLAASLLAVAAATLAPQTVLAAQQCSGHQLLPTPRPETSCQNLAAQIFVSPDKKTHAAVYPSDVTLYATPDMESRVVIRSSAGTTITSQDYSSPRGDNGYYVATAQWSPDSQYFVFSMTSSGGHSPWSSPMKVYSVKKNQFASFSDMINGNPTVSAKFQFSGPHTVVASTWKQTGDLNDSVPVTVDLDAAFAKLPASPN
jgi:hypothetical protein